jgi:hypothetical protein
MTTDGANSIFLFSKSLNSIPNEYSCMTKDNGIQKPKKKKITKFLRQKFTKKFLSKIKQCDGKGKSLKENNKTALARKPIISTSIKHGTICDNHL